MRATMIPLPSAIVGDRVVVRPFARGDGRAVFDAVDGSRAQLATWVPWPDRHGTIEDSEHFARTAHAKWLLREDLIVGVWDRGGALLGGSGLHRFDWATRAFEIGYWLRHEAQGQGYMREAVKLLAALAFVRLSAIRVEIACDERNVRSAGIPRALGFAAEAHLHNHQYATDGELRDTLIFALTPTIYRELPWRQGAETLLASADNDG